MTLTELESLADAATQGPWREFTFSEIIASTYDSPSCGHMVLANDGETIVAHSVPSRDVDFIAAANPATIKSLIALVRQQHEAVRFMAERWYDKHGTRWPINDEALTAYDKFEKGE